MEKTFELTKTMQQLGLETSEYDMWRRWFTNNWHVLNFGSLHYFDDNIHEFASGSVDANLKLVELWELYTTHQKRI